MSISLLDFLGSRLTRAAKKIYVKPNIPYDKAINAIDSYANFIQYEDVIVLVDDTVFGSAKEGMIFTDREIIAKAAFNPVIYREMMELESLDFKKGIMSYSILIDDQKHSLTQPDSSNIQYLIDKCNEYIDTLWSMAKEQEQEQEQGNNISSTNELEMLKKQIAQLEAELKSKTIQRESPDNMMDKKEIDNYAYHNNKSLFISVPNSQDSLINVAKEKVKIGNSLVSSLLTFNDSDILANMINGFIYQIIVEVRRNYIDKNDISGLKNDLATTETIIYATTIIKNELLNRGLNERFVSSILTESLKKFWMVEQIPNNNQFALGVHRMAFEDLPEEFVPCIYATRLYITNKQGKVATPSMEKLLDNPILEEIVEKYKDEESLRECSSPIEVLMKIIAMFADEVFSEIGYIPFDRNIESIKNDESTRIFQFTKQNGLI